MWCRTLTVGRDWTQQPQQPPAQSADQPLATGSLGIQAASIGEVLTLKAITPLRALINLLIIAGSIYTLKREVHWVETGGFEHGCFLSHPLGYFLVMVTWCGWMKAFTRAIVINASGSSLYLNQLPVVFKALVVAGGQRWVSGFRRLKQD